MRISDWSSDVCSSDLAVGGFDVVSVGNRTRPEDAHAGHHPALCHCLRHACLVDHVLFGEPRSEEHARPGTDLCRWQGGEPASIPRGSVRSDPCRIRRSSRSISRSSISSRVRAASLTCSARSEEHTSELQSLMRISYAVFCLKKK